MIKSLFALIAGLFALLFLAGCNPYNTYPTMNALEQSADAEAEHREQQTRIIVENDKTNTDTVVGHVSEALDVITEGQFQEALAQQKAESEARISAAENAANARIETARVAINARMEQITHESVQRANDIVGRIGEVAGSLAGLGGVVDLVKGNVERVESEVGRTKESLGGMIGDQIDRFAAVSLGPVVKDVTQLSEDLGKLGEAHEHEKKNGDDKTGLGGLAGVLGLAGVAYARHGKSRAEPRLDAMDSRINRVEEIAKHADSWATATAINDEKTTVKHQV